MGRVTLHLRSRKHPEMPKDQSSPVSTTLLRAARRNTRRLILEASLASRKKGAQRPAPDFVIVGAQRCGTTSLFRALAQHQSMLPNVIKAKGIHYFDTSYHQKPSWYFAHFPSQDEREAHAAKTGAATVAGEASPYYMYHPAGAERMAQLIPDTKLIVLLRNPVKRAISHHLHMVWEGHEKETDIDKALDLEASRLAGIEEQLLADKSLVSRPHQHYSYMARGHYAAQLEKLFAHFDRKNILVMATETLIADTKTNLATIQSFIGLEPDPSIDLEKRNASSKFEPKPETLERLNDEFAESNKMLGEMTGLQIPWA